MPRIEGRAIIRRPPEEVFDFVADAENNPKWHAHVHETTWLDDRQTGPGRRGRQVSRLFGRRWEFVAEVTDWDPPHVVAFRVVEGMPLRTTIRVEPAVDGSLVTLTVEARAVLGTTLDPLISRFLGWLTAARGRTDLDRLKALLEAAPR